MPPLIYKNNTDNMGNARKQDRNPDWSIVMANSVCVYYSSSSWIVNKFFSNPYLDSEKPNLYLFFISETFKPREISKRHECVLANNI